jgi:hypothetical protein
MGPGLLVPLALLFSPLFTAARRREAQDLKNQQDGLLLHSHPAVGGLNRTRLSASHANGYYDYWIHPRDWINHDKGKF